MGQGIEDEKERWRDSHATAIRRNRASRNDVGRKSCKGRRRIYRGKLSINWQASGVFDKEPPWLRVDIVQSVQSCEQRTAVDHHQRCLSVWTQQHGESGELEK